MATIFEQLEEIFNEYDNKINELTKRVEQLEKPSESLEKPSNPPFKVGDKVRILVLNYIGEDKPLYPIGTIGTIRGIDIDDNYKFYEIYSDEYPEHIYGWWYDEGDFELVEEEPKFPKYKFNLGDKVRTLKERNNGEVEKLFPIGTVGVIEGIEIVTDTTKQYQYKVATDDDYWYYDEENIELVKE